MWKSAGGHTAGPKATSQGAHTDTGHPNVHQQNVISGSEQQSASTSIEGSSHTGVSELRQKVSQELVMLKNDKSFKSGRTFGHEKNHTNKVAVGHSCAEVGRSSHLNPALGFGPRLGMRKDQVDKLTTEFKCKDYLKKHPNQQDGAAGCSKVLGAMFSVQKLKENMGKAAVAKNCRAEAEKPQSEKEFPCVLGMKFVSSTEKVFLYSYNTRSSDEQKPQKAAHRVQFENMSSVLDEDSRRQVEEDKARRQKKEHDKTWQQQRAPTARGEEKQRTPVVLSSRKTPEAIAALCKTLRDKPLPERWRVTGGSGPAVKNLVANSEVNGDYEDMSKAPVKENESEYEYLTRQTSAVAMYAYRGEEEDEISFNVKDIITSIEMADEAWWKGYCHGRFGYFPACFVQVIHQSHVH